MYFLWRFIRPTSGRAAVKPELNEIINLQLLTLRAWREVYYNFHKQREEVASGQRQAASPGIWAIWPLWTECTVTSEELQHCRWTVYDQEGRDKDVHGNRRREGIEMRAMITKWEVIYLFLPFSSCGANVVYPSSRASLSLVPGQVETSVPATHGSVLSACAAINNHISFFKCSWFIHTHTCTDTHNHANTQIHTPTLEKSNQSILNAQAICWPLK